MTGRSFIDLPDEIVRDICFLVHWRDVLALQATSIRLTNIADERLLWRYFCRTIFKHWAARHQLPTKIYDASFVQWKQLFKEHHQAQVTTRRLLRELVCQQKQRIPKIEAIVDLEYDSKDALVRGLVEDHGADDGLAMRYWSCVAIGCLHRSLAVKEWLAIRQDEQRDESYSRSIGAFNLFILDDASKGDLEDISWTLAQYVESLRKAHPYIDDQSPRQKATTTAQFLITNNLVGISEGRDYHNLEHNFLGRALLNREKNSLPLITVIIYCCVLRHLGLDAAPCGFPLHVHAIVQPPPGVDLEGCPLPPDIAEVPSMYMDPFRTHVEIPMSTMREQLSIILRRLGNHSNGSYLSASSPGDITRRCAHNILTSCRTSTEAPSGRSIDSPAAYYAAFWALTLYQKNGAPIDDHHEVSHLMQLLEENFPYDVGLIEKHVIHAIPEMELENSESCHNIRDADRNPPTPLRRRAGSPAGQKVKFKVGQVFRHKRYGYTGVVTGWDPMCEAGEDWIWQMNLERLDVGRRQPFYHSFVPGDRSMRYVAEQNIELLRFGSGNDVSNHTHQNNDGDVDDDDKIQEDNLTTASQAFNPHSVPIEIGKWFKRWDNDAHVFVSNVRAQYPDD